LDIFGANVFKHPYNLNSVRELLSLVSVVGLIVLLIRAAPKLRKRVVVAVGVSVVVANYAVYLASGQVLVWATSRYLVMLPLLFVVLVAVAGDSLVSAYRRRVQIGWLALTALSCLMLCGALLTHWPNRHSKDAHIYATVSFLQAQNDSYALSSREIGVTATYFANDTVSVLPLLCTSDHRLVPTDLFYDQAPFGRFNTSTQQTPLIVPTNGITSGSATCTVQDIADQFGLPQSTVPILGVGYAWLYPAIQLQAHLPMTFDN
jgi:hypothetical protein